MGWTFKEIIDNIKSFITAQNTSTVFSDADTALLKKITNSFVEDAALNYPIEDLRIPTGIVRSFDDYSTGTIAVTSQSVIAVVSSGTPTFKMIGRKIRINDESAYYIIKNVEASGSDYNITLDRPYLGTTTTGLTYTIFDNTFDLPDDCLWVKRVVVPSSTFLPMQEEDWDYIEKIDAPLLNTSQDPEVYCLPGNKTMREPVSLSYTAEAGTDSTTIVCSSFLATTATEDLNYYKGWTCINTTRDLSAKIVSYDESTQTIILDEAISGQTTGDTFFIQKTVKQISFWRRPSEAKDFICKYYRITDRLINDYDVPLINEYFKEWLTYSVLSIWFTNNTDLMGKYSALAQKEELKLKSKYSRKVDSVAKKSPRTNLGRVLTMKIQ